MDLGVPVRKASSHVERVSKEVIKVLRWSKSAIDIVAGGAKVCYMQDTPFSSSVRGDKHEALQTKTVLCMGATICVASMISVTSNTDVPCPLGWQISKDSKINDWVSPFVGFLIPAIVFCLAIPRRRQLNVPDTLFDVPPGEVASAIRVVVMVPAAALIAAIDTIQWLVTIFALAGPILLSGIYEAVLDSRLLEYLDEKMRNNLLSTAQRAHLLLVILVGNLDMMHDPSGRDDTAWNHIDR